MRTIEQTVKMVLAMQLGLSESEVTRGKTLYDDLGGDSLDAAEMWLALEEELETEIPDEAVDHLFNDVAGPTIGQIIDLLKERVSA